MLLVSLAACGPSRPSAPVPDRPADAAASPRPSSDAGPPTATADPAIKAFCLRAFARTRQCFHDDAYWDAFVTFYFAARNEPVAPEAKRQMSGNLKDDLVKLERDGAIASNCDVMIARTRLPTEEQMARVRATEGRSCAEFGSRLGWLIFHQGVFHRPR